MLSVETSEISYSGNGVTTAFSTTFYFLAQGDLVVTTTTSGVTTTKTLTTDYTVSGAGVEAGGTVTFLVAPAVGTTVNIYRDVAITQPLNLPAQGTFSPSSHEEAFDRGTMIDQQLDRRLTTLENSGEFSTVVAGAGLTLTGDTLAVGAGDGITVATDTVAVSYGLAAAVVDVAKSAEGAGTSPLAARIDHKHDISTAAAGAATCGGSAAEGVATSLARSDHSHSFATAAPANVTKAAASAGVAATFAASDHKHDITTAAAETITTANGEGTATSLARSDHTHDHGALLGGDRHAVATTAAHGFESATDKAVLGTTATATVSTTDATVTTVIEITPTDLNTMVIEVVVIGARDSGSQSAGYKLMGTFRRDGGTVTQVGSTTVVHTNEDNSAWDCVFNISSTSVRVRVTGAAGVNIDWAAHMRSWQLPA